MTILSVYSRLKHRYRKFFEERFIALFNPNGLADQFEAAVHSNTNRNVLLFLPTIDWNYPLQQRPQHLAKALANHKIQVIYATYNHQYDRVNGFKLICPQLLITNHYQYVLKRLPHIPLLLTSNQLLTTIADLKQYKKEGHPIIYDYVDEINPEISGSQHLSQIADIRHKFIKESLIADFVLCVSKKLYMEMAERYPIEKVFYVPNGVDYNHFHVPRDDNKLPDDLKSVVQKKKPIIGYYGALAQWIDYDLINTVAKYHDDWEFVFIGIDYNGGLNQLNLSLPNIHYLGQKHYEELPLYGIWFDVAIIPFIKGSIARSTSPLKLYEYMALGKPVVVTEDLTECQTFKGVIVSKNSVGEFEKSINAAIEDMQNQHLLECLDTYARKNSWDRRAMSIYKHIIRIEN